MLQIGVRLLNSIYILGIISLTEQAALDMIYNGFSD
jgi:hypothetical protein